MAYDQQLADALRELAEVKAREEMHWRTLRECADILCLPDESPSLLPEKIRLLQACALSEKRAKEERGNMVIEARGEIESITRRLAHLSQSMGGL